MARHLIFPEPGRVEYVDAELPTPGVGQVRLKTLLTGISHGTEMVAFLGKGPFVEKVFTEERIFVKRDPEHGEIYPYRWAGYDLVGEVVELGQDLENLEVGDRLFAPVPHKTECVVDVGSAEVLKLQQDTRPEDAIMVSLATVAFAAAQDAEIKVGDTVAVFGGGTVGQLTAQMAALSGAAKVLLVEPRPERRKLAERNCSAITLDPGREIPARMIKERNGGFPPDVVLECSGTNKGLSQAIQAAGLGGTVVAVGFYAEPACDLMLGEEFLHNRVTIKASMNVWDCPSRWPLLWNRARNLRTVLALIESGKLSFKGFVSLRVPFEEALRAYEAVRDDPSHLKVVLTYE